ncbi:autophagy protein atg9 [Orbilia oligospora]|uniref:Autophagy-related protein 9 n=1 Tax=Orbilia oligospora TaxID=2813651 RepID=A0A7C8P510_ORBOL|nr:autophagy protein atg9 [Orbilia oligospora]KAF3184564.1 autophagy protein atg9 [Orbilia oligospora]KAF3237742.1 autophagy protein atg9 [Orbilia oligospora]KAF3240907.1 autophagy protein atg9 [Orbilia oligospora]KAF3240908.1 autophagy protein atg9, variant 2 [Orbilia oligospora]
MASNLVSRFFGGQSIYESLRQHDRRSDDGYNDEAEPFEDEADFHANLEAGRGGISRGDTTGTQPYGLGSGFGLRKPSASDHDAVRTSEESDGPTRAFLSPRDRNDSDVPESLIIEGNRHERMAGTGSSDISSPPPPEFSRFHDQPTTFDQQLGNLPPPPSRVLEERWAAVQNNIAPQVESRPPPAAQRLPPGFIDPKQRAMYKWANVEDLDCFLHRVYEYYLGKGIYCICLERFIGLLTVAFVVGFSTYIFNCIDFTKLRTSKALDEITIGHCMAKMSLGSTLILWIFCLVWTIKLVSYVYDIWRLWEIHQFYHYLLDIPDLDMQTIQWQDVVQKLMALRDSNPVTSLATTRKYIRNHSSKQRMDAHDIANRLMRKENYLIALFNKDILDLSIPLPFLRDHQLLTKTVEWNLGLAILDFVFHDGDNFNPVFLKESSRKGLSQALRTRFVVFGFFNLLFAPFIVAYLVIHYFFQYFNEYQTNPSAIGSRRYTPLAEWKFREFNELVHLFHRRMNISYPFAVKYLEQFPKEKFVQAAKFVTFIFGSFAAVLAIASLLDTELLQFEITKDRTVLFYITLFGSITAVARGIIPAETDVFDPTYELSWVMYHTRYSPPEWKGRLHSDEVKKEFSKLYELKIVIFFWEVASIILTPFVMWFSLPKCSDRIIDFFREFTVHVDGIGYVCSFAEFDFNMTGPKKSTSITGREEYYDSRDNKMKASMMGFLDSYGNRQAGTASRIAYAPGYTNPLASPVAAPENMTGTITQRRNRTNPGVQQSQQISHSMYRGQASGLLDRHHHPAPSHARTLRQSVYHNPGFPRQGSILREEEDEVDSPDGRYISNLGESFVSTTLENDNLQIERTDDEDDLQGGGVIDLLRQFQRAHADNHGRAGVNLI